MHMYVCSKIKEQYDSSMFVKNNLLLVVVSAATLR